MKYNKQTISKIERNCNLCRGNFLVWLTTFNFDQEKERNIKEHIYNYCPACKIVDKSKNE